MSTTRLRVALCITASVAVACGSVTGGTGLTGDVEGDGSSTVAPISEAIAEEFLPVEPGVMVSLGIAGTGGGFEKFCRGETDFNDASRPIKPGEEARCADAGIEWLELQVALDGLTVIVNPENDWATCLTVEELATIWGPASEGTITRWNQVRDGFPDEPLELFGPGPESGTFDYFTEAVNGDEGAQRTDYGNIGEDDNQALRGVQENLGGLAYFGFAFFVSNSSTVKAVEIDGGDGCVAPSVESVREGSYAPLSRPLFVYVRADALQRPAVFAYFEFYLDIVNQVIEEVGYVPLDETVLATQLEALRAAAA